MYVRKDGVTYNFCSSKCFKNLVELGRVPRRVTWTRYYEREKQVRLKSAAPAAAPSKKRKAKKVKAEKEEKPEEAEVEEKAEDLPEAEGAEEKPEDAGEEKPAPKKTKAKKDEEA